MNALLRILAWTFAVALVVLPVVACSTAGSPPSAGRCARCACRVLCRNVDEAGVARDGVAVRTARVFRGAAGRCAGRSRAAAVGRARRSAQALADILEVHVVEHRPFARWGEDRLLSEHGRLFPVRGIRVPARLPQLGGPDARVPEVVALYNESRALFASTGNDVRALKLDARGSWSLVLSDGAEVIVGRSDARPRLGRFARLLPQLINQPQRVLRRADLRYTNGFALQWAAAPAAPASTTSQGKT